MIEDLLAYIVQRCEELAIETDDADARAAVALYRSLMDGSAGAKELDDWLRTHHMAEPVPVSDEPAGDDVEPMAWFDALAGGRRHSAVD